MPLTDQVRNATANRGKLAAVLLAAILLVLIIVFLRPRAERTPAALPTDPAANPGEVLQAVEQQRAAVAEAMLRTVRDEGTAVLRAIERVAQLRTTWDRNVQALLQNEDGRRLAADPDRVRRFAALLQVEIPDQDALAAQRTRVQTLMAPVDNALSGKLAKFSPDEELRRQLGVERDRVQKQERALTDNAQMLSALQAEGNDKNAAPGDETLRVKIDRYEQEVAAARLRTIQEAQAKVEQQETARLADLRAQEARDKSAREQREMEAELRRKKAEDPTIQADYKPFLQKGRFLFQAEMSTAWSWKPDYGDIPAPASYSRLKQLGVLSNEFVFWASGVGSDINDITAKYGYKGQGFRNDRTTWTGWPKTEAEHKIIKDRFNQFVELAPIWVEMGLLRP